jgi:hypothetical protein
VLGLLLLARCGCASLLECRSMSYDDGCLYLMLFVNEEHVIQSQACEFDYSGTQAVKALKCVSGGVWDPEGVHRVTEPTITLKTLFGYVIRRVLGQSQACLMRRLPWLCITCCLLAQEGRVHRNPPEL